MGPEKQRINRARYAVDVGQVSTRIEFFSSRRRHRRCLSDWSSDVCSSDLDSSRLSTDSPSKPEGGFAHGPLRFISAAQRDSRDLLPPVEEQHELLGTAAERRTRFPPAGDDPHSVGPLEIEADTPDLARHHRDIRPRPPQSAASSCGSFLGSKVGAARRTSSVCTKNSTRLTMSSSGRHKRGGPDRTLATRRSEERRGGKECR